MTAIRRLLMAALCFAAASLVAAPGHAQGKYPDHPVKVLVGFTAGGGTDVAGRVIAQKLSEAMGQTFVVENRAGASGLIASEAVAKADADGYTIMVGSQTTLAVAPALYKKFQLDTAKELTGLAMIGISPLVAIMMVWPSGMLLETCTAAVTVPAPGRFSITNCLPKRSVSFCAISRPIMSVPPPGANGTTKLT